MLRFVIALNLAVAVPAAAQDGGVPYATKADISAVAAKAAASVKPGHGTSSAPIFASGGYTAKLEYHVGPNIANAHPHEAELFEAVEGSGTLVTGGTIVKTATGASIVVAQRGALRPATSSSCPRTCRTGSTRWTATWC